MTLINHRLSVKIKLNKFWEAKMRQEGKIVVAFILGGLIGASLALLYAPKSGAEIRKDIKKKTKEIKKKTMNAAEALYEEIEELSEDAKKEILQQIEKISKLIEEKKKKLLEKLD